MNPHTFFSGDGDASGNRPSPRKELQLQGPRPSALKINKDSYKIRKPPVAPPPQPPPENRPPVIIYAVPPKIIHTTVSDYKSLVQRLTGNTAEGGASSSGVGDLSPAARLASIEKTSPPKERETSAAVSGRADDEIGNFSIGDFVGDSNVELGALPGILSPAPGSLPPISPGFFSPTGDPFMSMLLSSPTTLFTAPMVSPSPSYRDLFNPFFDF